MPTTTTGRSVGHKHAVYYSDLNRLQFIEMAQRNAGAQPAATPFEYSNLELVILHDISQLDKMIDDLHSITKDMLQSEDGRECLKDNIKKGKSFAFIDTGNGLLMGLNQNFK